MLDQNNNGYVDQEEEQEAFDKIDTNNDGQISESEAQAQPNLYQDLTQHAMENDPFAKYVKQKDDEDAAISAAHQRSDLNINMPEKRTYRKGYETWPTRKEGHRTMAEYYQNKATDDFIHDPRYNQHHRYSVYADLLNTAEWRDPETTAFIRDYLETIPSGAKKRTIRRHNLKGMTQDTSNKVRWNRYREKVLDEILRWRENKAKEAAKNEAINPVEEEQLAQPKGVLGAALLNTKEGKIPGDTSEKADLRPFRATKPNSDPDSQRLGLDISDEDRLNWNKGEDRKVGDYTLDQWNGPQQVAEELKEAIEEKDPDKVETIVENNPEEATQVLDDSTQLYEEATQIGDGDERTDEVRNDAVEEAIEEGPDVVDYGLEDQNQYGAGLSKEEVEKLDNELSQDDDTIVDDSEEDATIIPEEATHDYFADLLERRRNRNLPAINSPVVVDNDQPQYEEQPQIGGEEQLSLPEPERGEVQLADIEEEGEEPTGTTTEEEKEKPKMDLNLAGGSISGPGHKDYNVGDSFVSGTTPVSFDEVKDILSHFSGSSANGIPGVATLDGISEDKFHPETEAPSYSKEGENIDVPDTDTATSTGTGPVSKMFNDIMRGVSIGGNMPHTSAGRGGRKASGLTPKAKGKQEAAKMTPLKLGSKDKRTKGMKDHIAIIYERIIDKALKNYKSWPLANDGESHVKEKGGIAVYVKGDWISCKYGSYRKTLLDTFLNEHPQFAKNILEVVSN